MTCDMIVVMISKYLKGGQPPLGASTLVLVRPENPGNRMEEWEYCLLWASPRKTVIITPGGEMEKFTNNSRNRGILTNLQADGWQTVAFNMEPTVDMTYLFKRQVKKRRMKAEPEHLPIYIPMQPLNQPSPAPHAAKRLN